ncbi:hypothetical protein JCM3766R1_001848 [Sporobolomyces carnicolor]
MSAMLATVLLSIVLLSEFENVSGAPFPVATTPALLSRQYVAGESVPYFPQDIASCQTCQPGWDGISSCAKAAPAFEFPELAKLNPASFYNAIKCGCTDTFNSAYPQCVDCFVQTNQCQEFLGVPSEHNATNILDGIRNVCGFASALIGNVANSQSSAGISYTYTGVPSQGYSISTTTGVGGLDYGSAQGRATSGASRRQNLVVAGAVALSLSLVVLAL